jgi:hypothetical protein
MTGGFKNGHAKKAHISEGESMEFLKLLCAGIQVLKIVKLTEFNCNAVKFRGRIAEKFLKLSPLTGKTKYG